MNKRELQRAKRLIENDRLGLVEGSEELIRSDVEALLKEYFALIGPAKIRLVKNNDRIRIFIEAECSSVKRFLVSGIH